MHCSSNAKSLSSIEKGRRSKELQHTRHPQFDVGCCNIVRSLPPDETICGSIRAAQHLISLSPDVMRSLRLRARGTCSRRVEGSQQGKPVINHAYSYHGLPRSAPI